MLLKRCSGHGRICLNSLNLSDVRAGCCGFAGINAEWNGMKGGPLMKNRLPDLWLKEDFSEADLTKVFEISGVEATSRRFIADAVMTSGKKPVLRIHIVENNEISKPHPVAGQPLDLSKDGIWLDCFFAEAHGIGVGDVIQAEIGGITVEKKVLGLIMHPEYIYCARDESQLFPQPENFGFAFMPRKALHHALPLPYNQLLIRLDSGADERRLEPNWRIFSKGITACF